MSACTRSEPPHALIGRFRQCSRGSVAIIFAFAVLVLVGSAGLAIDYGRMVAARGWLQNATDAAVLAAAQQDNEAKARQAFDALLTGQKAVDAPGPINASIVSYDAKGVKASASVTLPLTLAAVLGSPTADIRVEAAAGRNLFHEEIYFGIDLSSSLGVAATDSDRTALEALTRPYTQPAYGSLLPQGCAFGCHVREGWEPTGKTVFQMAREAGIRIREDELKNQFAGLVDILLDPGDPQVANGMRTLSVIGFSGYARQLISKSTSQTSVKSSLNSFPDGDKIETRFAPAFAEFGRVIGTQGDGKTGNPYKTLVVITDGIESRSAYFAQHPIDTTLCDQVKGGGIRLAIVEIKYPKLPANALYRDTVEPVEGAISPALSACASPGWYFQATNNSDVPATLAELGHKITAAGARLTQ